VVTGSAPNQQVVYNSSTLHGHGRIEVHVNARRATRAAAATTTTPVLEPNGGWGSAWGSISVNCPPPPAASSSAPRRLPPPPHLRRLRLLPASAFRLRPPPPPGPICRSPTRRTRRWPTPAPRSASRSRSPTAVAAMRPGIAVSDALPSGTDVTGRSTLPAAIRVGR
jgi:hypothetical protein